MTETMPAWTRETYGPAAGTSLTRLPVPQPHRGEVVLRVQATALNAGDVRLLDPATEPARVRAMFTRSDWTRRGLGRRILEACEAAARRMSVGRLYLETNSGLTSAVSLYERFGFAHLPARPTPYARADVFMEKRL